VDKHAAYGKAKNAMKREEYVNTYNIVGKVPALQQCDACLVLVWGGFLLNHAAWT